MPKSSEPPLTLKPTALASLLAGKVTLPKSTLFESSFSEAPLPMKRVAPVMFTAKSEPRSRATVPSTEGSSIPETVVRLRVTLALPNTTSAMLRPTLPPIRNVGSVAFNTTPAEATAAWVQSSTPPCATEVLFNWKTRLVLMSFTASTPCI